MAEMHRLNRCMVRVRTETRARRALRVLDGHLPLSSASRVLELGSGGGGMVALLEERLHPARLVGTDYDPVQVEAVRRFLMTRWSRIPDRVEVRAADALHLPFESAEFDAVFAMMMLHHVEAHHFDYRERPAALAEIRRVLRPAGVLVYSEFSRRPEVRRTLGALGFSPLYLRSGWRVDLAIYRTPGGPAESLGVPRLGDPRVPPPFPVAR